MECRKTYEGSDNVKDTLSEKTIVIPELEKMLSLPQFGWSERDTAILRKYYGRVPASAIAKQLDRSALAVRRKAEKLGLRGNPQARTRRT
jgi:hypothetical protein